MKQAEKPIFNNHLCVYTLKIYNKIMAFKGRYYIWKNQRVNFIFIVFL